jgi:hypothetical protein
LYIHSSQKRSSASLEPEILLDRIHQPGAELLAAAMHWKNGFPAFQLDPEMTSFGRFKCAALCSQPPLELIAVHRSQQIC